MEAIQDINKMDTADQAYHTVQEDNSVQAMLQSMYKKCDCHLRYKESLLKRMNNQKLYREFLEAKEVKKQISMSEQKQRAYHRRIRSGHIKLFDN